MIGPAQVYCIAFFVSTRYSHSASLCLARCINGCQQTDRQCNAKKVLSDYPGLVDLPIGQVDSILCLPVGEVKEKFLGKFKLLQDCKKSTVQGSATWV